MEDSYIQTSIKQSDYISFKTECSCLSHDMKVILQKDNGEIKLSFYDDIFVGEYVYYSWYEKIKFRIKNAWNFLIGKGIEIEHEFYFKNEKHVEQFIEYINQSYQEIK